MDTWKDGKKKKSPSVMQVVRSGAPCSAWGVSALNRFLQEEVLLVEELLSSTPPSSSASRPAASTQSEKSVARSWRSSFTSRSFCRMSAGQEDRRTGGEVRKVKVQGDKTC